MIDFSTLDFSDLDGAEWVVKFREHLEGVMQLMDIFCANETDDTWRYNLLRRTAKDTLSELNIFDSLYGQEGNYAWLENLVTKYQADATILMPSEDDAE